MSLAKSDLQKKTFKACTYIYIPKRTTGLTDENKSNSTTAKVMKRRCCDWF